MRIFIPQWTIKKNKLQLKAIAFLCFSAEMIAVMKAMEIIYDNNILISFLIQAPCVIDYYFD